VIRLTTLVAVPDASAVAEARRAAMTCASSMQFDENLSGKLALAATELATNLVKHGGGGELLIGTDYEGRRAIDLVAIDAGKGFGSVESALRDGFSTAGSSGTGLGAISRVAAHFEIYSQADRGTAVLCRIEAPAAALPALPFPKSSVAITGICLPKPGEEIPGDDWLASRLGDSVTFCVADGLGHGPSAADASRAAINVFREREQAPIDDIMRSMHEPLRPTRGAAVAVARLDPQSGSVAFVGVGNIAGAITTEDVTRRTVSQNGTVGHEMRRVQTFTYPWAETSMLVMHSDGLTTNWSFDEYHGLALRDPSLIAAVLLRDFWRRRDDVTIVVAKETR
jgi:anti-sigma regulatory factor (Ser/Thr protein kinase)